MADFETEMKMMSPLRHPNVIFFYGGVWTEGVDRMCLVVEFAGRGSLDALIGTPEIAWEANGSFVACTIFLLLLPPSLRRATLVLYCCLLFSLSWISPDVDWIENKSSSTTCRRISLWRSLTRLKRILVIVSLSH